MGDPKKSRKTFKRPRQIWTKDQLSSELYLLGTYGLRSSVKLEGADQNSWNSKSGTCSVGSDH
jgi:hypothetical protein